MTQEATELRNQIARLQQVLQGACDARTKSDAARAIQERQLRLDQLRTPRPDQEHGGG